MTSTTIAGNAPTQQQIDALVQAFTTLPPAAFAAQAEAFDAAFPQDFTAQNLLGAIHAHGKDFARAEAAFRKALAARPDALDTQFVHGIALFELARHEEAVAVLGQVLAQMPANGEAAHYRACSLNALGRHTEAAEALERLVAAEPANARAFDQLAHALLGLDRGEAAQAAFERAITLDPRFTAARLGLIALLEQAGQHRQAEEHARAGASLDPDCAEFHERIGWIRLLLDNDLEGAEAAYRRVLELDPHRVDSLNNLGLILHRRGELGPALDCFALALRERPDMPALHSNIGFALQQVGALDEALAAFEHALLLDPAQPHLRGQKLIHQMLICDWRALDEYAQIADTLGMTGEAISSGGLIAMDDNSVRQRARAAAQAAQHAGIVPAPFGPRAAGERIRVGYFSADFHDHATMHLMAGLFRCHDRSRFEVSAFSYGLNREGAHREALKSRVDHFIDVAGMPDAAVVDLARAHNLDIAVDLKGYTQDNRIALFAHRLAPVQVSYLGFPGTLGAPFLDYVIGDPVVIPDAERAHYSEQVIRLPGSYQPNDDQRPIAPVTPTRSELDLPEAGFVFACFNNAYKITPREWDIWMRLLASVPGSVLWLFKANPWAEENLRREAVARGIAPERLVFAPWAAHGEHLARLRAADLFLDTFAYNAHTTASDALWAGLPVVTMPGRSFAARVAASLVTAVGLPELAVPDEAAYEALALSLAQDPARLADLRARLAAGRGSQPLFDSARHTRAIEAAYAAIHARRMAGLPPADIDLPEDAGGAAGGATGA